MFDQDQTTENQHSYPCQKCDTGGVFCDGQSGDWICENCGHNYTRPERSEHAPDVIKTLGRQTGIGYSDGKLRQREKNLVRSLRIVGRRLTDD